MSPFNLEAALSGEPVVTRDGREVKQVIHFEARRELWPVAAVVDELVYLFTAKGKAGEDHCSMPHDLFMG